MKRRTKKQIAAELERREYYVLLRKLYDLRHEAFGAVEYLTTSQPKGALEMLNQARKTVVEAEAALRVVAARKGWRL